MTKLCQKGKRHCPPNQALVCFLAVAIIAWVEGGGDNFMVLVGRVFWTATKEIPHPCQNRI